MITEELNFLHAVSFPLTLYFEVSDYIKMIRINLFLIFILLI